MSERKKSVRQAEAYRSGHNEAVLKTVWVQAHGGSNPSASAKIKSRHFCKNGKCRLFCRMKMCYNISKSREFILLRRRKFELY